MVNPIRSAGPTPAPFESGLHINFWLKGINFQARLFTLTANSYTKLGINPRFFRPGMTLRVLDRANYSRLCKLAGFPAGQLGGLYPLAPAGEETMVNDGRLARLPDSSRVLVLHEKFSFLGTLHEVLHDVFLGGALSLEERNGFTRLVLAATRRVLNTAPDSEEARFIRTVASEWKVPLDLTGIRNHDFIPRKPSRAERIFANEMFAYAAEKKITGDNKMGQVPDEIDTYLDRIGIKL
jgi:hypothetical protein